MTETHRVLGDGTESGSCWVEFKSSGYPFKLQRQLKEARDDVSVISLIVPFVQTCHLPTVTGGVLTTVLSIDDLSEVDEATVVLLIKEFYAFRQERMYSPLSPNA